MDSIQAGDVIIIQRQSYMKTHKLSSSDTKASIVQLGNHLRPSTIFKTMSKHERIFIFILLRCSNTFNQIWAYLPFCQSYFWKAYSYFWIQHIFEKHICRILWNCSKMSHPLCFLTAFSSDATSQLFSWERGGASDVKNPDPYYSTIYILK